MIGAGLTVGAGMIIDGVNKMERKRLRSSRKKRHFDLEGKLTKYQNQLDELQVKNFQLQDELTIVEADIYAQKEKMYAVKDIKYEENTKFIVALGITGDGKSTLCNRLCGDNSEEGNKGPFVTDSGVESGMRYIG